MRSTNPWPILRATTQVASVGLTIVVGRRVATIVGQIWWLRRYTGTWWDSISDPDLPKAGRNRME